MADLPKSLWKSLAEHSGRAGAPEGEFADGAQEPPQPPEAGPSRRRFMGLLGASAALASTAGCRKIDRGPIIPYSRKPEEVTPGVANFYASTFQDGTRSYGVLVKAREGRPVHLEGNAEHPIGHGKAPVQAIADLLGLYDPDRLKAPLLEGRPASWAEALERVSAGVRQAVAAGKEVLLITGALISPAQRLLVDELRARVPSLRQVAIEPSADQVTPRAARTAFGEAREVRYRFDRAEVVVSVGADFLGTMDGATEAIAGFAERRMPAHLGVPMSRLYALEGAMTLTGSKADHRLRVRPGALAGVVFAIARTLFDSHRVPLPAGIPTEALSRFELAAVAAENGLDPRVLQTLARDLARARAASLVIAGPAAPAEAHLACHLLNAMLGAEGTTLESAQAADSAEVASVEELDALVTQMKGGKFGAAIVWDANPAYHHPDPAAWAEAFAQVGLRVRLALGLDETARACQVVLPVNHWLESWGDFQPARDLLSLRQPLIAPLFETRQAEEVLLWLAHALGGEGPLAFHAFLQQRWRTQVQPPDSPVSFEAFWNACLHDGVARLAIDPRAPRVLRPEAVLAAAAQTGARPSGLDLVLHPDAKVRDGRYANNGWLQELPDPVTKVTWGNPVRISVGDAQRLEVADGDELKLEAQGRTVLAAAVIQPGQAEGVLALALGYGRSEGSVGGGVGVSAWPMVGLDRANPLLVGGLKVTPTGRRLPVVRTQEHHSLGGRDIARLWTRAEYAQQVKPPVAILPAKAVEPASLPSPQGATHPARPPTLYPDPYPLPEPARHKWGMAIDLAGCVGCSACVVACQSENNVPVVGPEQVAKGREMAWLRIDRYYQGNPEAPQVVHEPMLCQHCDHAPCENVCPVAATTHSADGLNQMTYNRCVGTRYCANNCPFKVRRFNFFELNQGLGEVRELAFNPEVTVRPRGVMEKCTFCVQRISNVTQIAKAEGRALRDGEVTPACAAACPAQAIVFGDTHDPHSRVSKLAASDRGFHVLEELGVRPAITYLADLRNPAAEEGT